MDSLIRSKDQKIRRVNVRYYNAGENVPRITDRCVRSLVRLFNVEDSTLSTTSTRLRSLSRR